MQLTEALAGLERTRDACSPRRARTRTRSARTRSAWCAATSRSSTWTSAYETDKPVLDDVSFVAPAGTVTALVGSSASGQEHDHRARLGVPLARRGPRHRGRRGPLDRAPRHVPHASWRRAPGLVPVRGHDPRERRVLARRDGRRSARGLRIARVDEVRRPLPGRARHDRRRARREAVGGQRQRVSIARAAGRSAHPHLDEATSSLDPRARRSSRPACRTSRRGATFVIAHRLDDPPRRPDPCGRGRTHRGARRSRGAVRRGRTLPRPVRPPARALSRTCSSRPGEGDDVPRTTGRAGSRGARARHARRDAGGARRAPPSVTKRGPVARPGPVFHGRFDQTCGGA